MKKKTLEILIEEGESLYRTLGKCIFIRMLPYLTTLGNSNYVDAYKNWVNKAREYCYLTKNVDLLRSFDEVKINALLSNGSYHLSPSREEEAEQGRIFRDFVSMLDAQLNELRKTNSETDAHHKTSSKAQFISYNPESGIGNVGKKEFRFKHDTREHRVFGELCKKIGQKMNRYDVLVAAHFYEDGEDEDAARRSQETEVINEIAKNIRGKTGLTIKQLVQNAGNLTLVGEIDKKITKTTPNTP